MTAIIQKTIFVNRESSSEVERVAHLYSPNESLGEIYLKDKRICHLFWKDYVSVSGITRTIHFDWWVEQKPEPAEPVQTEIQY